jgi:DNA-binding transcriptional LysR family regulator
MTPSRDSDYSDRWRVALPHATVAPHNIVASSDLLATMAERVARVLAPPLDLVILEPPSELLLTGFTLSMLWHERTQTDPARRWLREVIVAEATERLRPPTMLVRRAVASRKRSS